MNEPEFLSLTEENVAADEVTHHYYMVSGVGRPGPHQRELRGPRKRDYLHEY